MTSQERVKDIERLVNRSSPGANDSALRAIGDHVFALRSVVTDRFARGKLADIERWSEIYFSHRKHQKHAGGGEQVAVWILAACRAVADALPET